MSEDTLKVEIDGRPCEARKGEMLIQVADRNDIYIPRFCYHDKLSVAANCRMCLVEVEKAPKPMPACATPVSDGMKAYTKSSKAISAQKATMEFLLINHPLDCPICDQGGECELQDLALGYGSGVSRFNMGKRVVSDPDLGPLISTDMTRCIHCTRCVRFTDEIAGEQELGAWGRGEDMKIGTYIQRSVDHELSGNVIDLCPVGALNNKPFRMGGRAWEMMEHAAVSPHDPSGSNMWGHVLRGEFKRVVPRDNEDINETWLADRDRFSCEGVYSLDRVERPMVKHGDEWVAVDWQTALEAAAEGLRDVVDQHGTDELAAIASSSSSLEELYLVQRLTRGLGSGNVDHRLAQVDFRDDAHEPVFPALGAAVRELEALDSLFVIGSNIRKESPIIGHRIRKAGLAGGDISFLNPRDFELHFPVADSLVVHPDRMVEEAAAVLKALAAKTGGRVPKHLQKALDAVEAGPAHERIAGQLTEGEQRLILLGHLARTHPAWADLRAMAAALSELSGTPLGYLPVGGNGAGAWLAGAVPHRDVGGGAPERMGAPARELFDKARKGYLLVHAEPEIEAWNAARAAQALKGAERVVVVTPFLSEAMKGYADVILPAGTFAETSGTWVNAEGRWQSVAGFMEPVGETRPAWKILRVLGNLLELDGFEYHSTADVLDEIRERGGEVPADNRFKGTREVTPGKVEKGMRRVGELPIYGIDALVRRADPLQRTADAREARSVGLSPADAKRLELADGDRARVSNRNGSVELDVRVDEEIPDGAAWVSMSLPETAALGEAWGTIEIAGAG